MGGEKGVWEWKGKGKGKWGNMRCGQEGGYTTP